jgi:hypothetical protein
MKTTFSQGDIVKFKEGLHENFVLITQAQFDAARAHYMDPDRKVGDQTVLVESGMYNVAHPGTYMSVAACRPNSQLMLVIGEKRHDDGRFTAAFIGASMLDIVE